MLKPELVQMMGQMYESLPTPSKEDLLNAFRNYSPATFLTWIKYCYESPDFSPRDVMQMSIRGASEAELDAYMAPFPSEEYMMGGRMFPYLVPLLPHFSGHIKLRVMLITSELSNGRL